MKMMPSENTTTFENRYDHGSRSQWVHAVAAVFPLQYPSADVLFFGPVLGEFSPAQAVAALPKEGKVVAAGLQGWLRQCDEDGKVHARDLPADAPWTSFDLLVVSEADFTDDSFEICQALAKQVSIVALTQGDKGSLVFVDAEPIHVPAAPATEMDPTGAGDVYAAAFACGLAEGKAALQCAEEASRLAALCVTAPGATALGKSPSNH